MNRAPRGWLRRPLVGAVCLLSGLGLVFAAPGVGVGAAAAAPKKPCPSGLIALTFDDGPSPTQTPRLVKILREKRVPATFFMVGQRVRGAPAVARLVQDRGFGIANHTWAHPLLTRVSDRAVRDQLQATVKEMRRHGVRPGPLMRPPYGGMDARVRRDILGTRMVPVLWSVDSRDWAGGSARQIADRILSQLRPHGQNVVLQHDGVSNSPNSISAVPLVVTEARRRGYCFTALDDRGRKVFPVPKLRTVPSTRDAAPAPQTSRGRPAYVGSVLMAGGAALEGVYLPVLPLGERVGFRLGAVRLPESAKTPAPLGAPAPGSTTPADGPAPLATLLRHLF